MTMLGIDHTLQKSVGIMANTPIAFYGEASFISGHQKTDNDGEFPAKKAHLTSTNKVPVYYSVFPS